MHHGGASKTPDTQRAGYCFTASTDSHVSISSASIITQLVDIFKLLMFQFLDADCGEASLTTGRACAKLPGKMWTTPKLKHNAIIEP